MRRKWRNEDVPLGFTFHKFFKGHGWFKGEVVKIRIGAIHNKTRRIRYEDGDVEDLSIREIQRAYFSHKRYLSKLRSTNNTVSSKRESTTIESPSESNETKERSRKKLKRKSNAKEESDQNQSDISNLPVSFICFDNSDVESQITQDQPINSRCESISTPTNVKTHMMALAESIEDTPLKSNTTLQEESQQNVLNSSLPPSDISIDLKVESVSLGEIETESKTRRTKKIAKRKNIESKHESQSDKFSMVKLRNRKTPELHEPSFGDVGFELYKFFPDYGWCKGMIIYVYPGKYAVRRIVYEQGIEEELCLSELQELMRRQERYLSKSLVHNNNKNNPASIGGSDKKIQSQLVSASSTELNEALVSSEFDELEDFVPLDSVAEFTLQSNTGKKNDDDSTLSNENWLATIASQIKTKSSKNTLKKSKTITVESDITKDGIHGEYSSPIHTQKSISPERISVPTFLTIVERGKRHGCKVIDINDPNRIVGQVLLEPQHGWLEVNVGSGESKKGRTTNYVVVPSSYKVGDVGPRIQISSRESITVEKRKDCIKKMDVGTDGKLSFEDVIYWFCGVCKERIDFDSACCPICQRSKRDSSSISSVLLEIAENVCIAHDNQNTLPLLPALYRKCIPREVLSRVQMVVQGRRNKTTEEFTFHYDLDSLFYWQCHECTMSNSFRRWTCLACKKKRCHSSALSPLLRLVFEFVNDEKNIEDAIRKIPIEHSCAIPKVIVKAFDTCIENAKKTKRRCRCPKLHGSDYCASHQKVLNISTAVELKEQKSECVKIYEKNEIYSPIVGVEDVRQDLKNALRGLFPKRTNPRDWQIKCIEDAFICERNDPFPLGLGIRRYFAGYGWHDGFITIISRRDIIDNSEGKARPVLIYRVEYNDGDQEDLLHHEVNSLRQLYNIRSVRSTAPAHQQIEVGTEFETMLGKMKILELKVDTDDARDKGTVHVEIETANEPTKQTYIELLKLERIVLKLLTPYVRSRKKLSNWFLEECDDSRDRNKLPFIEWPPNQAKEEAVTSLTSSVQLHHSKCDTSDNDSDGVPTDQLNLGSGYDPSRILQHVSYNPFESIFCQVCHNASNDHYLLICDECDRGYHTYCLRPVVVNIPREIWLCPKCNPDESTLSSYEDIFNEFMKNSEEALSFLKVDMKSSEEYCLRHRDSFEVLNCKNKWSEIIGKKKAIAHKVGDIYITRSKDRHYFKLPEPIQDPELWTRSLASIAAAAKYCGMECYTESLVYEGTVSESMNDVSLDKVQGLSKVNLDIFEKFKSNLKMGIYPPVEVVYDVNIGFLVKALVKIPKHTIVAEYIGAVNTITECRNSNSDSLMSLLLTGDDSTSLIIDPSRVGNMARFFSGINNKHYISKKNANMRTRRFAFDGKCRVVLFTCKDVMEGDILHYDYNAGVEGKSVDEMIQTGFYDTSNFL